MAASPAAWAVVAACVGENWALYTLMAETPTYLDRVQRFPITEVGRKSLNAQIVFVGKHVFFQNGLLSGLPFLVMWLSSAPFGLLSDSIRKRTGGVSTAASRWKGIILFNFPTNGTFLFFPRKIMNSIGALGTGVGLLWLSVSGCDHTSAALALCLAMGLNSAQ